MNITLFYYQSKYLQMWDNCTQQRTADDDSVLGVGVWLGCWAFGRLLKSLIMIRISLLSFLKSPLKELKTNRANIFLKHVARVSSDSRRSDLDDDGEFTCQFMNACKSQTNY